MDDSNRSTPRKVVLLDTNALHYLALFVGFARDNGFDAADIEDGALSTLMSKEDDSGYRRSLQKGHALISFIFREDAQVEYSQFTVVELLCGRIRGAAIMSLAREQVPERMWSRIDEKDVDERSMHDLPRIKDRVEDMAGVFGDWNIMFRATGASRQSADVLLLARDIVGLVYMTAADSVVYAEAVAARADYLVTDDRYLRGTVNRIHSPGGNERFQNIAQELTRLGFRELPRAYSCAEMKDVR